NSRSVPRVFAIDQNLAGDVIVEILPEGSQLADIRDETVAKLPDSSAAELTAPLIDSVTEGVAVTAGAIALSGTGSPNVEHQLFVNGELIDSTKSDAEGRWSFDYNQNQAGTYEISILGVGEGDDSVASESFELLITTLVAEEVEPEPTLVQPTPTLEPTATVIVNEEPISPTADPTLPAAEVAVEENDSSIEPEESEEMSFNVAINPVEIDYNSGLPTTISGTGTADANYGIYIDGVLVQSGTIPANGKWSFTGLLPAGEHTVEARLFDGEVGEDENLLMIASEDVVVIASNNSSFDHVGPTGLLRVLFSSNGPSDGSNSTDQTSGSNGQLDADGALAGAPAVELILDASWSMTLPLDSDEEADRLTADNPDSRIAIAQAALIDLIENKLPEGAPVALRAFGNIEGNLSCRTDLMTPLQPLDIESLSATINSIEPQFDANTAIAASLAEIRNDLAATGRDKVVVLLTDGQETCGRDPGLVIQSLAGEGTKVQVNIIGFAIQDEALKAKFQKWAELGNGQFFDATDAELLGDALVSTFTVGYSVVDLDGNVVARGTIGGRRVELEAGIYNILDQNGEVVFEHVVVTPSSVNELVGSP
ncbi:MAG: VWA domain-containing protein, partial [Chloroflexota bacterium]